MPATRTLGHLDWELTAPRDWERGLSAADLAALGFQAQERREFEARAARRQAWRSTRRSMHSRAPFITLVRDGPLGGRSL